MLRCVCLLEKWRLSRDWDRASVLSRLPGKILEGSARPLRQSSLCANSGSAIQTHSPHRHCLHDSHLVQLRCTGHANSSSVSVRFILPYFTFLDFFSSWYCRDFILFYFPSFSSYLFSYYLFIYFKFALFIYVILYFHWYSRSVFASKK
jgi:hypothetical protein